MPSLSFMTKISLHMFLHEFFHMFFHVFFHVFLLRVIDRLCFCIRRRTGQRRIGLLLKFMRRIQTSQSDC